MCGYSMGHQVTQEPPGKVVHLRHRDYTSCQYKYPPRVVPLVSNVIVEIV